MLAGQSDLEHIGDTLGLAYVKAYLGLALETEGDLQAAVEHFTAARLQFDGLNMPGESAEAAAGLARCACRRGQLQQASLDIQPVWDYLEQHGGEGMEFAGLAYLTVVETLTALGQPEQARLALERGYAGLLSRAEKISDPGWRASFLDNVPEHRRLMELWKNLTTETQRSQSI